MIFSEIEQEREKVCLIKRSKCGLSVFFLISVSDKLLVVLSFPLPPVLQDNPPETEARNVQAKLLRLRQY